MNTSPSFSDNILVKRSRDSNEYLSVSLAPYERPWKPYRVSLTRYSCPGRCYTYSFSWNKEENHSISPFIGYYSEGWYIPIAKSAKLITEDLDKPQVVKMLLNAFRAERIVVEYRHDFLSLLKALAPKSKSYKKVLALCGDTMSERSKRIAAIDSY